MPELFIEKRGRGAAQVVLIHGWAMHGGVFAPLVAALEARCTLHVVDLPGHGRSRDCGLPLEAGACARLIAARTPPALWLGWSLGGLVALTAALEHAQQVRALAMLCASPRFARGEDWPHGVEREVIAQLGRDLDRDYRGTLERFLALETLGSERAREELRQLRADLYARGEPDPRVLHEGLAMLDATDLRARLPELTRPSAWIAGRRDRLIPWAGMAWSAEQCEGGFACLEHAGHAPFLGYADAVVEALEPLLAEAA